MGPYGSEIFKTLLLQLTAKSFQSCPEISFQKYIQRIWYFEDKLPQLHCQYP